MNKLKLKIMATSLALSAASSGAWGAMSLKPELDASSGCYIWRALKAETSPGFFFPGEAPYITGDTSIISQDNSPLFLLRFDPSFRADENDSNVRKARGLYNPSKIGTIFGPAIDLKGKNVVIHVVMQPFPENTAGGLYIRPDLTCLPTGNPMSVTKRLSFGISKVMINGVVNTVILKKDNQEIIFQPNSLGIKIESLKLEGINIPQNCQHLSFWSYVGFDNTVFITYHWLINRKDAMKLRNIHRIAFFAKQYGDSAYSAWSAIYSSDMLWRANYEAVCRSFGKDPISSTANDAAKQAAYRDIINLPAIKGFLAELNTQGHISILRFMWRLKDDVQSYDNNKGDLFYKHSHEPGFVFLYSNN
ncbi:MAG: hypothetical protein LBG98_03465 [Puniceicoccales bacterium]|jgi:hypothetical protein|nr:hypothetical protein [Puniceicoccales bacterium]